METKILDMSIFDGDTVYTIINILIKMGWNYDFNPNGKSLIVNIPMCETDEFDFIFDSFM